MKKPLLSLVVLLTMGTSVVFAQENRKSLKKKDKTEAVAAVAAEPADVMKFKSEAHDFGNVKEGDKAEYEFTFVNKGKTPVTIQNVTTTCGCTSPNWSKEPVAPGKKGTVTVSYSTAGRVGPINRQVTVLTDAGNKVLKISGTVVAKPTASVPQNNSAIKAN
ncbi:MAG: DUF1573 domain-containing protein [Sphingobacteriales bacterium]|nr:MAG: DUF1573 domain-containing protein [Sphingobacteriales bacterium]